MQVLCQQEIMVIPMMWIMSNINDISAQKFSVINTILQCPSDTVLQFRNTYYIASILNELIAVRCKDLSEKYAFEHAAIAIMILNQFVKHEAKARIGETMKVLELRVVAMQYTRLSIHEIMTE